jgi:hypothetical protein
MKKYKQFINESKFWNNLDDEDLIERRNDLTVERDELNEQIAYINSILRERQEDKSVNKVKNFPKNIFELNSEQLDFIFEHHHDIDTKHYEISKEYFRQLSGVDAAGFNNKTNQFHFNISSSSCFNDAEDGFELNEDTVKSIKFLGENLKSENDDGWVRFGILYEYHDGYGDKILYKSENEIKYGSIIMYDKKSISELLESIVDDDLVAKDNSDSW